MEKKILVETSARHIHLTDEAVAILYGADAKLEPKKMLSQPGQFATANEKIKVVGPKGELMLSVLGPTRKANQVELSYSDARVLGLKSVPVRESGDVAGTPGLKDNVTDNGFFLLRRILVGYGPLGVLTCCAKILSHGQRINLNDRSVNPVRQFMAGFSNAADCVLDRP